MDEEPESRAPDISTEWELDAKLRELAALDKVVDQLTEQLKDKKRSLDFLSWQIAQYMLRTNCLSKVLDNITFKQVQRVYSKVEDKDKLRTWIEENGAVDVLMAVHASKLTAYCNECLENGTDVPDGVNPNFIKYSVRIKHN